MRGARAPSRPPGPAASGGEGGAASSGRLTPRDAAEVAGAGANVLVSGTGIFKTDDYAATIAAMRAQAERGLAGGEK